nr:hypothetical protein [uncultured Vibrio sp.]
MNKTKNLKGYTLLQRNMAYAIRNIATSKLDLSVIQENRIYDRIMAITSPMFFIKYRNLLESGKAAEALSKYQDENYQRKASFIAKR